MRYLPLLIVLACDTTEPEAPPCDPAVPCEDARQFCDVDVGQCVDPWRFGSPEFEVCVDAPGSSGTSLGAKAATYLERAHTLHVHPELDWMMNVDLSPGADPATATWEDVLTWRSQENDGLWSGLFLAAEAFRYASTTGAEREDATQMLRRLLHAQVDRMAVSGVPGNFVRMYRKPGIAGLSCPKDDESYRADVEKDDNRWVRVNAEGCVTALPADGGDTWVVSDACPGVEYADWCFFDNTSKDEYAGHLFALSAVLRLVDDAESQEIAGDLLRQVATHLLDNEMRIIDHDGRPTEHGDFSPSVEGGVNAALGLSLMTMAAQHLGDERFVDAYRCFAGLPAESCPTVDPPVSGTWVDWLPRSAVHLDADGCLTNDNVASMFTSALVTLLWWESDPDLRAAYQSALDGVWDHDSRRALSKRQNAWYDMMWAAFKPLGPDSDGPALAAVTDATCGLSSFPDDKVRRGMPRPEVDTHCVDRLGHDMSELPLGPHERCKETFWWWKDQYRIQACEDRPDRVDAPADYLLPYWMGRYFGFIDPSW